MPIYALESVVPQVHPDAYVHPDAVVIGDVRLAAGSSVWPGAVLRGDMGYISVGERTSIQDGTVLHTTPEWPTVVGNDCVVGHLAHLEGCTVEEQCLIGSGSVVLNRAVIRRGSVVGAKALVPEGFELPSGQLAVGVPARLRPLDPEQQAAWIAMAVHEYTENAARFRGGLRRLDLPPGVGGPRIGDPLA